MNFNSLDFLIFFPVVVMIYFIIGRKYRYIYLLAASYYFYMCWNPKYALLMVFSTLITWLSGVLINRWDSCLWRKGIVVFCLFSNIGILVFFKYFNFLLDAVYALLGNMGITVTHRGFDIILPVGISFYIFQALSYTIDVYRGQVKAEKNILKYALFVSFFPQLVAGPIERSGRLLRQIEKLPEINVWDYKRVASGLILMLWGYFQKMVIADRVAVVVNTVFESYYMYHSFELVVAAMGFALQIYCDFASYSAIAVGAARVMGFSLMENFDTPYFSCSIKEFWRRWHISLSTWFRDYLYIPLKGSRCTKWRRYCNLMITFLTSGLWHGANWTYFFWGVHGLYQIAGMELKPVKDKINSICRTKVESVSYKIGQVMITFLLTDFAWIFFRSETVGDAFYYITRIFTKPNPWALFDGTLYNLGLNRFNINILVISVLFLFVVDVIKYKKKMMIDQFLEEQCIWFRWGVLFIMIVAVLVYGSYGPAYDAQQFIYFQF